MHSPPPTDVFYQMLAVTSIIVCHASTTKREIQFRGEGKVLHARPIGVFPSEEGEVPVGGKRTKRSE